MTGSSHYIKLWSSFQLACMALNMFIILNWKSIHNSLIFLLKYIIKFCYHFVNLYFWWRWWFCWSQWLWCWKKTLSLIFSRDHYRRSSPSQISNTLLIGVESMENLSSGFAEWSYAVLKLISFRVRLFATKNEFGFCSIFFLYQLSLGLKVQIQQHFWQP